jgi:glycosyltransferase involved in cell wall biosynthesis
VALDAGGPFELPLRAAGVPLDVICMRNQADLARLGRSRLIRRFSPDVVVSRGVSGMYVGHVVARWRRARHAYNEHRQVGMALSHRREAMSKLIAKRVDLVIAVTSDQAGAWLDRRLAPGRIVVVPNGVPAPDVSLPKAELRRELQIPDGAIVALLAARLRPEKQVPAFIRAVKKALLTHPELIALIAGDGPDRTEVRRAAADDPGIWLLGHRDDVPRLLGAADMFVLASDFEAVPMAILEAMATGLPVVATNVGSISDVIRDGDSGILVAPGDPDSLASALVSLAGNPALRERLGDNAALVHRQRFSAEEMIDRYAAILGTLADRRPARPPSADAMLTR